MTEELSVKVRLRPTRIGFLVRPSDRRSIRKIMRLNACLWGGTFNPMIPVFRNTPRDWKEHRIFRPLTGKQIAEGYVRFFEPDVYVEAEDGLLEMVGLGALRDDFEPNATQLDNFFDNEYRGLHEPVFGQSVFDVIDEAYNTERRFKLRDPQPSYYSSRGDNIFSEIFIGVYPDDAEVSHLKQAYRNVFEPELIPSTPESWLKLFHENAVTPFSVTRSHFDVFRTWSDDPVVYVFDPSKTTDLIDLWNLRIQPAPIIPVPFKWFAELSETLRKLVEDNYRPLKDNPHGVMHSTTFEFARSISEEYAHDELVPLLRGVPAHSFASKHWRTRVWQIDYGGQSAIQPERAKIVAEENSQNLVVKDDGYLRTEFESLSPSFAERYSGSKRRWVNILTFSHGYSFVNKKFALSLPYNTFDSEWPFRHLGEFRIGREGWVFLQDYVQTSSSVSLLEQATAFSNWFERQGLKIDLSEAGRVAKQVLESLDGIWGLFLLDDVHALKFVNKLANSTRTRRLEEQGEVVEEEFTGGAASIDEWKAMIHLRQANGAHSRVGLKEYIEKNVIRIGLETECSNCNANNWHDLDEVSYEVKCTRCLNSYPFPQAEIKQYNQNWKYRVVGPFAVPDYAQGAYTALLTIRFFTTFRNRDEASTYSTAMEISKDNETCEVDFAIWTTDERGWDIYGEPKLIIGEAKSFAADAIKEKDLVSLKKAANLLANSVLVIAVLKEYFSQDENERLTEFVEWTRQSKRYGPKHRVILLTSTELFDDHLENNWKEKGKPHSDYANFQNTRSLDALSDATLSIYLGMQPYHQWYEENHSRERRG